MDFEIIMVSNSREVDSVCELCLADFPSYSRIIFTEDLPIGMARNEGVSVSSKGIIVFLDGDTIVGEKNTLSQIVDFNRGFSYGYGAKRYWSYPPSYFEKNSSLYLSKIKDNDFDWIFESSRSFLPKGIDINTGHRDLTGFSFIGNFGFVNRSLFERVGGFDNRFQTYGGEDDYLAYRLYREEPDGFKNFSEHLRVLHINHPSFVDATERNFESSLLLNNLLLEEGISSFNINVLFSIPDYDGEPVLERSDA